MSIVQTIKRTVLGSYVPVIVINSAINSKTTQDVRDCIYKVDADRAVALALLINSPGGSPAQCDIITEMVRGFTKKHHLPLYTFADDIAASGGQFLLSIGDKSYVQDNSLVGSVGVLGMWFGLGNLAKDYKLKPELFTSNEEQLQVYQNFYGEMTPEKKEKILVHLRKHHDLFIAHTEKYSRIKLSPEERKEKIFNATIVLGRDAVKYGLVDEIGSYQSVLKKEFPEAGIELIQQKSWRQRLFGGILAKAGVNIEENSLAKNLLMI